MKNNRANTSSKLTMSLKKNFSWSLFGNIIYAACQWGIISVIAKMGTVQMVGQFSLGLAISAPLIMLTNLQLRSVQATDTKSEIKFGNYLGLRILTGFFFTILLFIILVFQNNSLETILIVLMVSVVKLVESVSDVIFGLFQKEERMDKISISRMIKGIFSVIIFTIIMLITDSLVYSLLIQIISLIIILILFDLRNAKYFTSVKPLFNRIVLKKLLIISFPLGIVHMLGSLNTNLPRYFLENTSGEEALGYFAAMAYIIVAGDTVITALGQSATPRLAKYYSIKAKSQFINLISKLTLMGFSVGILGTLITFLFGAELLEFLYTKDYASNKNVFLIIVISANITYLGSFISYAITAARFFKVQSIIAIIRMIATAVSALILIPRFGLYGASITLVISAVTHLICNVIVFLRILNMDKQVKAR